MIALTDELNQKKVDEKSKKQTTLLRQLRQSLSKFRARHQQRKLDRLALRQLLQLDDALLKDIGLSRHKLMSVRDGALTVDALIKQDIMSKRDNARSTTRLR